MATTSPDVVERAGHTWNQIQAVVFTEWRGEPLEGCGIDEVVGVEKERVAHLGDAEVAGGPDAASRP